MLKPICVPCQRFFRPTKNGFAFIEGMPGPGGHDSNITGTRSPDSWEPYKAWMGDQWGCPDCGATIVVGVGHSPLAEHYQPDFAERVAAYGAAQLQVNDC